MISKRNDYLPAVTLHCLSLQAIVLVHWLLTVWWVCLKAPPIFFPLTWGISLVGLASASWRCCSGLLVRWRSGWLPSEAPKNLHPFHCSSWNILECFYCLVQLKLVSSVVIESKCNVSVLYVMSVCLSTGVVWHGCHHPMLGETLPCWLLVYGRSLRETP